MERMTTITEDLAKRSSAGSFQPESTAHLTTRNACAQDFAQKVTERLSELEKNKHLYHFWVDRRSSRACFGLTFEDCWSELYSNLKDLTPELFSGMMKILFQFQQQQEVDTSKDGENVSILSYHLGKWKTTQPFHIKIHASSMKQFRSTILHYGCDENIVRSLMSDETMHTEYDRFKSKLDFIRENSEQGDAFHVLEEHISDDQQSKFYVSRKTYSIVATNSIDMSKCENPYHVAYSYARMLETTFKHDVGGVNFGIDHCNMKMWVWADFEERLFEENVLRPRQIVKTEEFLCSELSKHMEPKPANCKGIYVKNVDYDVDEHDLENIFIGCGRIQKIVLPKDERTGKNKGCAYIYFCDPAAIDKAMESESQPLNGRTLRIDYMRENRKRSEHGHPSARKIRRFTK